MDVIGVASIASDLILAATMAVFLRQSRHMSRGTSASVYQTIADQMMSIDRLFVDHPELRQYFYDGVLPPREGLEAARVRAATELMVDFMDNVVSQSRHLPEYLCGPWRDYFRDLASTSPGLRQFWREHRDWYDEHMQKILDGVCLQEDAEGVPSP